MNVHDLTKRMLETMESLRASEVEAREAVYRWTAAEKAYKRRQALARLEVKEYRNADERDSKAETMKWQDGETVASLREAAHTAEESVWIAKEVVRNRRQELSALQTLGNLEREEMALARTGPQEGP